MDKRIIFRNESGGVSILVPIIDGNMIDEAGNWAPIVNETIPEGYRAVTVEDVASKDVPADAPFRIVDVADLPDRAGRDGWQWDDGAIVTGPFIKPSSQVNAELEMLFVAALPQHMGQPYCTAQVIRDIMQTKVAVIDANRIDPSGTVAGAVIASLALPSEMEAARTMILAKLSELTNN